MTFTGEDPLTAILQAARQLARQDRILHRDRGKLADQCSAFTLVGEAIPAALLTRQRRMHADLIALGVHRAQLLSELTELRRRWLDVIEQLRKGPRVLPDPVEYDRRAAIAVARQQEPLLLEALRLLDDIALHTGNS